MKGPGLMVGVDLDNTIVDYDALLRALASERGFPAGSGSCGKKDIRDMVRRTKDGEEEWQKMQGALYGPRMAEALPAKGARAFLSACRSRDVSFRIISHKTEYAGYDDTGTNLRDASREWLRKNGFFAAEGPAMSEADVWFESTRGEKIARIRSLHCTHFIDDLEETFMEESFPDSVERILYSSGGNPVIGESRRTALAGVRVFADWHEIHGYFFESETCPDAGAGTAT